MSRPGDRRKRWNQSCGITAFILMCIGTFLFVCGLYWGTLFFYFFAYLEMDDIKKGWKIKDERPPWARSKNGPPWVRSNE